MSAKALSKYYDFESGAYIIPEQLYLNSEALRNAIDTFLAYNAGWILDKECECEDEDGKAAYALYEAE